MEDWVVVRKSRMSLTREMKKKYVRLRVYDKVVNLTLPIKFRKGTRYIMMLTSTKEKKVKVVPVSDYKPTITWKVDKERGTISCSFIRDLFNLENGRYVVPFEEEGDSLILDFANLKRVDEEEPKEKQAATDSLSIYLQGKEKSEGEVKKKKEIKKEDDFDVKKFLEWAYRRLKDGPRIDSILPFDPDQVRIRIPEHIYEEWGKPEWVEVRVDPDDQAIIIYPMRDKPIGFIPYKVDPWRRIRPKKAFCLLTNKEAIANWPNFLLYRTDPDGGLRVWIPGGLNNES
mgnify:CR=1 FL=1